MNKQFFVTEISSFRGNERLTSILSLLHLTNRWKNYNDSTHIDYKKVNLILNKEIEKGKSWLNTVLSEGTSIIKHYNPLDDMDREVSDLKSSRDNALTRLDAISFYIDNLKDTNLSTIYHANNIKQYLTNMKDNVVLMSVCDDASNYWGMMSNISKIKLSFREAYCAIISDGNILETQGTQTCRLQSALDETKFEVISDYCNSKPSKSDFIVNNKKLSSKKRGINILVYSKTLSTIIDFINVDLYGDSSGLINRLPIENGDMI